MNKKRIIGHIELIDLPELNLYNIQAKIDTGAETSVLHCEDFFVFEEGEQQFIRFNIKPDLHKAEINTFTFPICRERKVRSSFGQTEKRHIFITKVRLFDQQFNIRLSLRDRSSMAFPMLLGKNFINGKFLVDVSKKNLAKNSVAYSI